MSDAPSLFRPWGCPDSGAKGLGPQDADRKRKILITDKCTMAFKKWQEKGESFRVDRYRCSEGRCLHQFMSRKTSTIDSNF
jgi:hypothetical protein